MKIIFESEDGTKFESEAECRAYENKNALINHIKKNITTDPITHEDIEEYIIKNYQEFWSILYNMNKLNVSNEAGIRLTDSTMIGTPINVKSIDFANGSI